MSEGALPPPGAAPPAALAETAGGVYTLAVETGEIESFAPGASLEPEPQPVVALPRVVATAAAGSTVLAAVDAKPPLLVSHDAGITWRESGRGLPRGAAVAVAVDDPDLLLFGAGGRVYVSRDGGRFWQALPLELPEDVVALSWL